MDFSSRMERSSTPPKRLFQAFALTGFSLLFLIGLSGCEKEGLKKPTKVGIAFKVDREAPNMNGSGGRPGPPVSLEIKDGEIRVEKIRIIGERQKGEDIDFERKEAVEVPIADITTGPKAHFDLPQGTYKELKIRLTLAHPNKPSIECLGERIQHPGNQVSQATPFRLHIKEKKIVECEVDPKQGKDRVELRKGNSRTIRVRVQPGKWFHNSGSASWNQASIVNDGGEDLIPIEQGKNPTLHSKVLQRIENAFNSSIL